MPWPLRLPCRHARAGHAQFNRQLQAYLRPSLLIVDEVGYLPLGRTEANMVFQLVGPTHPPRAGRFPPVPSAAGRVTSAPFKGSTR
jgi:hypothetical protein